MSESETQDGIVYCTYENFEKIKLRVAEVIAAECHPKADKLLKLQIKVGDKQKQICAGIRSYYTPESLIGKRIIIIDNLEPRMLRGEVSEGMLLAATDAVSGKVILLTTDDPETSSGSAVR